MLLVAHPDDVVTHFRTSAEQKWLPIPPDLASETLVSLENYWVVRERKRREVAYVWPYSWN
jgi:hypothetical protein